MTASLKTIDAITLFIEDVPRSKDFYQNVFGAELIHEDEDAVAFTFDNTGINLLRASAAHELIAPAMVGGETDGARVQFTIGVDDVDAMCEELVSRGVTLLNGPMDRPWGIRTASFTDPDGHIWEIAHRLPAAGA
jgi:catechol 2,3-dioxygenase-like lactoylglutathione lyase family enzyme